MRVSYRTRMQPMRPATGPELDGPPPLSYAAALLRPYLDLTPATEGPLHAQSITWRFRSMVDSAEPVLPWGTHQAGTFRRQLTDQLHLPWYAVRAPADLPASLRTPRWDELVRRVAGFHDADWEHRFRVVEVLQALALYECVVDLTDQVQPELAGSSRTEIAVALRGAEARARLSRSPSSVARLCEALTVVARNEHLNERMRLGASLTLLVRAAKSRDRDDTWCWRQHSSALLDRLTATRDPTRELHASLFWRAACYVPFLDGRGADADDELDRAEAHALAVPTTTQAERVMALQNLYPVLETRSKVALWRGDPARAMGFAERVVTLDPLDPKVQIELADLLLDTGRTAEALARFRLAAGLGPPYTPLAWQAVGHCHELLGDQPAAADSYLRALEVDPYGVSSVERLGDLASSGGLAGTPALSEWVRGRPGFLPTPEDHHVHH
jgi:tetratricopeptide (TPR) repeat protein